MAQLPQGDTKLVISELLCFVVNKSDSLPPEAICQLCLSTFSEDEIEKAKKLLYELCGDDSTPRMVLRKGPKKKSQTMENIKFIHDKGSKLPKFVALNLQALPPVTFNSLDVLALLHTIKQTQAEVSLLKEGLASQAQSISDLHTVENNRADTGGSSAASVQVEVTAGTSATSASSVTLGGGSERKSANPGPAAVSQAGGGERREAEPASAASTRTTLVQLPQGAAESVTEVGTSPTQKDSGRTYAENVEEWKKMEKVNDKLRVRPEEGAPQSARGTVSYKPKVSANRFVGGSAKQSGLLTVKKSKHASVFASRFDTNVSAEMLKSYLEGKLSRIVQVTPVKTRYDSYHSFHVMSQ